MFFIVLYKYLDSLKWVILIGFVVYYFSDDIKKLLGKKLTVKHGDTSFEFNAQNESKKEDNTEIKSIEKNKTEKQLQEIIEKKDSEISDKEQQLFKLRIEKHFEYTYRLIFRSQIYLLQNLQIINDGFSVIQIETHFENNKKLFAVFNTWTPDVYLKFLYDQNLILKDSVTGKIKITNIGDLFLKYLIINGYDFNNEKNL